MVDGIFDKRWDHWDLDSLNHIGIFALALVKDQCTDETHLYAKDLIQSKKNVRYKLFLQGLGPTEQRELTFVKTKRKTDPESSESDLLLKQPLSLIMLETRALQFNLQIIVSPWLVVLATHFRSYLRRQACSCCYKWHQRHQSWYKRDPPPGWGQTFSSPSSLQWQRKFSFLLPEMTLT